MSGQILLTTAQPLPTQLKDNYKKECLVAVVIGVAAIGLFILIGYMAIKDLMQYGSLPAKKMVCQLPSAGGMTHLTASNPTKDAFVDMWNKPHDNMTPILILAGLAVVLVVGALYLIKKQWDKKHAT